MTMFSKRLDRIIADLDDYDDQAEFLAVVEHLVWSALEQKMTLGAFRYALRMRLAELPTWEDSHSV